MTVSSTTSRVNYTGDGILTTYAYPFRIFANSDLVVYVQGLLVTAYTVTGAGNAGGGNVIFTLPPTGLISIVRILPETQATDYVANDAFPAETHEAALDKLTMIDQQNTEAIGRSLSVALLSTQNNLVLDDLVGGKFLRVKAGATGVEMSDFVPAGSISIPLQQPTGVFGKLNNIVFVEGVTYPLSAAGIQAAHDSLPSNGGVIVITDALTLIGTVTISKSGVSIILGNFTIAYSAGAQILVIGDDFKMEGQGSRSVLDASAGTSATSLILIRGNRSILSNFKLIGNRVAGGTGTTAEFSPSSGTIDRATALGLYSLNAGGSGIVFTNVSNAQAERNTVETSGLTGIYSNGSNQFVKIRNNTVIDCNRSATSGHGGILAAEVASTQQDISIEANRVTMSSAGLNKVGIGVNGGNTILISGNRVIGNNSGGECIAVTADNVRITENEVNNSIAAGILFYATAGGFSNVIIAANLAYDNAQGIAIVWGANSITIQNVMIYGNRAYDTGAAPVQTQGIQAYDGAAFTGKAVKNFHIFGNVLVGNATAAYSLLRSGVTGDYTVWGNTETDNVSKVPFSSGGVVIAGYDAELKRLKANQGAALVSGDFALHANWGNTAAVTSIIGTDQAFQFVVTSAGTGQGANPTIVITDKDGSWTNSPIVIVKRSAGSQPTIMDSWTVTATALTITFNGTPSAAETYTYNVIKMGR